MIKSEKRCVMVPGWISLFILLVLVTVAPAKAMIISVDGLLSKVLENNQNVRSFYFELEALVYNPEAFSPIDEQLEKNLVPYEVKENGYFQKVVWVRDEYCLIETLDFSETPLNMYIFEPVKRVYSQNLQESRLFSNEDLVYPYLIFFTKHVAYLKTSFEEMGINASQVLIKQKDMSVVYQLGDDSENILVDPSSFRILEINRLIQIGGRYYPLQIHFSDWDSEYPQLPRKTSFYVNSRLFKEMRILLKKRRVYTPRRNFLTKYHKMLPQLHPFSLNTLFSK